MNKLLFFLAIIPILVTNAQTEITGTIIDQSAFITLPYAYLKVDDTGLGTVTDGDGNFKISIPEKYNSHTITLSYLGYKNLQLKVSDFKARTGERFFLIPKVIALNEVVLTRPKKALTAKALLKQVIKRIPENYANTPSLITGYYRETMKENGVYIKYTDAACDYYASPYTTKKIKRKEYQFPYESSLSGGSFSFDTSSLHRIHFHHRTLKTEQLDIIESRSSSSLSKLNFHGNIEGGPLSLFARDRVKYQQSFLGRKAKRDFTYTISEEQDDTGTWVYVLDFHTKTSKEDLDALYSTRNRRQWKLANQRKLLKGRIYINQNDLAIVRYECVVPNVLKKYFCGYDYNEIKHFDYKLDVRFKKKGERYLIDQLRHEDEFIFKDSIRQATTYYSAISEFKTTAITTPNLKKIAKEDNFANIVTNQLYEYPLDYDTDFWENYTAKNPIAIIDTVIRKDMEFEKELEIQFRDKHIRNDSMPEPVAKINPTSFKIHGKTYVDNYAWLKDTKAPKNNDAVMNYLREENEYAANYNIPLRKAQRNIYKSLIKSVEKNSTSLPKKENGYYYYSKFSEDDKYPVYYRKAIQKNASEEELFNVNTFAIDKDYYIAGLGTASPNNKLISIYENTTGKDSYILKIKNLEEQTFLTDSIPNIGSMLWLDNASFLYTNIEKGTFRSSKVMRHILGTNPENDIIVYEEKDPSFNVGISKSKSKAFIFLTASSGTSSETWYLNTAHQADGFQLIRPREKKHIYSVLHHKNQFYILTNKNALNHKVVTVGVDAPSKRKWTDIVPHQPDVLIQDFQVFDNYFVINEKEKAQSRLKIINLVEQKSHFIKMKEKFYNISISSNPDFATDSLQFSYSSFETPLTTFRYHMKTKEKRLIKQHSKPIVANGFDKYLVQRKWVPAKDGKSIPLTLISTKWRAKRKGNNHRVYLTSYGSYGLGQDIASNPTVHHLVNRGYVYAIAHIRGGNDLGNAWYEQGKLLQKKNTFSDFIACADYLIAENYAKKGSIVASGGSAGGLLMGVAVNERPDLFNTVILNVPFVDVINTMLDENLPLTAGEFDEWGNPKEKKYYKYIKSYSPYDNVKKQDYPNLLFFAALNDTRVGYWEPAKMVAKLRATKTDNNVLLFKTNLSSGHGGGSGRYASFRNSAYTLALIHELNRVAKKIP